MKFKFLSGDINWKDYGGKWISKKFNHGDFDFAYVRELINWHGVTGKTDWDKYLVTISCVAPDEVSAEQKQSAMESCWQDKKFEGLDWETKVKVLYEDGIKAGLYESYGNNYSVLFKEANKEMETKNAMFGFVMDRPQNMLGSTGWDFVKGNIDAGLKFPTISRSIFNKRSKHK